MSIVDTERVLDRVIVGRVTPRIYAFTTNTVPNYLKVGDTYRPVSTRLHEWEKHFPNLSKHFEGDATISGDVYFRDYAVHRFLEQDLDKARLQPSQLPQGVYYSREFFRETQAADVESAIEDIQQDYAANSGKYVYYDANSQLPQPFTYERGATWSPRPNQQEAIDNFKKAVEAGRSNLLMYAVMRFGKSFTSLCCAKAISAKTVLVVSAKADVKNEWKKTVEVAGNFDGWHFVDSEALVKDEHILDEIHHKHETALIFLTLQDLQGKELKEKHHPVFSNNIDVLIVDESHYGARAEEYGRVLREAGQPTDPKVKNDPDRDDEVDPNLLDNHVKKLQARVKLHLSGTPYRILMGSEFAPEDIVSFVQFSDIVREQQEWDQEHLNDDDVNEWDNPYFGFPQMIRFAFNPNESSRKKMQELREQGYSFAMSKLLEPESTKLNKKDEKHRKFKHESEILDLLQVIDGTKEDENVLGFLDYDKLKEGKMCRHMVIVLPYRASCDALEKLVNDHNAEFKNLANYQIINISGLEGAKDYRSPDDVKRAIAAAEAVDQKTITLTVNRMLTGSTVEQWDTMLFLKDTSSPQEYDQAIFRLQNQYTRTLVGTDGKTIKENLKPQTLLVDFDPGRLFRMQEQKSLIYNVNTDANGNDKLEERLQEEVRISPIITINAGKINEVQPTDILQAISDYNKDRSVADEARDVPIDLDVLQNDAIRQVIEQQAEIGSRSGLTISPVSGSEDELDPSVEPDEGNDTGSDEHGGKDTEDDDANKPKTPEETDVRSLQKKLQTYYQRILFYAMLTSSNVKSLAEIIASIETRDNQRIANNLGLDKSILQLLLHSFDPLKLSALDYKIQNISQLGRDESLTPIERASRALAKFSRISDSEVRTPSWLCRDMINQIPAEQLKLIVRGGQKLLDIASKSGEFALAFYQRLTQELGLDYKEVENSIYSIPTSSIAYEFTRRFYEILGLNIDNIAVQFTAYDLLTVTTSNGQINNERIAPVLTQKKSFNSIQLNDQPEEGATSVKFGAVVGNPPYQDKGGSGGDNDAPIYQHYVNQARSLHPQITSLVIPSRWFSGGRTSLLGNFRKTMLNDRSIRTLVDYPSPDEVFPDVEIKGGVCFFVSDASFDGDCECHLIENEHDETARRDLRKYPIFIRYPRAQDIVDRITYPSGSVDQIISADTPFGIPTNPKTSKKNPFELFEDKTKEHDVLLVYNEKNRRKVAYVRESDIKKNVQDIPKPKVVFPKTGWTGNDPNVLGNPMVIPGHSACSQTYLYAAFDSQIEALNFEKYYKTRFFRFLVSVLKITQDAMRRVYAFVPLQDFDNNSQIDWSMSVEDIDAQLFQRYGLNAEEVAFIESRINPML